MTHSSLCLSCFHYIYMTLSLNTVPERVNGFSANSSLPTTISMSWSGSNATVDYYMVDIDAHIHVYKFNNHSVMTTFVFTIHT